MAKGPAARAVIKYRCLPRIAKRRAFFANFDGKGAALSNRSAACRDQTIAHQRLKMQVEPAAAGQPYVEIWRACTKAHHARFAVLDRLLRLSNYGILDAATRKRAGKIAILGHAHMGARIAHGRAIDGAHSNQRRARAALLLIMKKLKDLRRIQIIAAIQPSYSLRLSR